LENTAQHFQENLPQTKYIIS